MKILTVTCLSVAALQIAIAVTRTNTNSVDNEIAMCISTHSKMVATASMAFSQEESSDKNFVLNASEAGRAEVALGKLALQKAASSQVKDFAQMMVDDHTKANDELRALADKKGITLSAECKACQQKLADLQKVSGNEFDKKYMEMMIADHNEVYDQFSSESSQGKDQEVKGWASNQLPALQHHLTVAEGIKL